MSLRTGSCRAWTASSQRGPANPSRTRSWGQTPTPYGVAGRPLASDRTSLQPVLSFAKSVIYPLDKCSVSTCWGPGLPGVRSCAHRPQALPSEPGRRGISLTLCRGLIAPSVARGQPSGVRFTPALEIVSGSGQARAQGSRCFSEPRMEDSGPQDNLFGRNRILALLLSERIILPESGFHVSNSLFPAFPSSSTLVWVLLHCEVPDFSRTLTCLRVPALRDPAREPWEGMSAGAPGPTGQRGGPPARGRTLQRQAGSRQEGRSPSLGGESKEGLPVGEGVRRALEGPSSQVTVLMDERSGA